MYNILVTKWKHGIGPNYIVIFIEELKYISALIIELVNIDESLYENEIVIFITKNTQRKQKTIILERMTMETALNFYIPKKVYIMILIDS